MALDYGSGARSSEVVQRLKRLAPGGVCFDPRSTPRIRRFVESFSVHQRIVDIGAANRTLDPRLLTLDIDRGAGTDIVADAHQLPFSDASVDGILMTGVLEHVKDPYRVVAESYRVLRRGGRVYIEVPFLQGYHAHPHDYHRFTQTGVRTLMRPFAEVECGVGGGPSSALAWLATEYMAAHTRSETAYLVAKFFGRWLFWWIKYFDWFSSRSPNAHRLASGFYFLGRKQ